MSKTVSRPGFEWDYEKGLANLRKHHISFDEATTVFLDPNAIYFGDTAHAERIVVIGFSRSAKMLYVVFVERRSGDILRIISAREAVRSEEKRYAKNQK